MVDRFTKALVLASILTLDRADAVAVDGLVRRAEDGRLVVCRGARGGWGDAHSDLVSSPVSFITDEEFLYCSLDYFDSLQKSLDRRLQKYPVVATMHFI